MENNTHDIWKNLEPMVENCLTKAFEKYTPKIAEECSRRDKETQLNCNAHNLFRRESDVDRYNDMVQNFSKMRKKELVVFGISITAINGLIVVVLRKFFS